MTPAGALDVDASTLGVARHRNRVRLLGTLLLATLLYWLAAMIAAVTGTVVLVLAVFFEGGDLPDTTEGWRWLGIGLLVVIVLAAVIGSLVAAMRLPRQRRRLEQQVLTETGARIVTDEHEQRRVRNVLDALAIAAGLSHVRFAIVDDPAPNSFAVGTRPAKSIVAVTTGAIDTLARDQLEAVLAYEISRIGSWDVALSSWTVALTGAAIGALNDDGATEFVGRLPFRASVALRRWAMRDNALDRDRAAVRFTRNPMSLRRALETLRTDPLEVQRVSAATAPLWFEAPARVVGGWPSLEERISALARLGAGSLDDPAHPHEPDLDKGVRGFDSVRGIGGSEPTSPERR